jgi:hypothetical protein
MLCAERKIMKYQFYCLSVDLPGIQPMIFHPQGKHTNPKLIKIVDSNGVLVTVPMGQTTKVDQYFMIFLSAQSIKEWEQRLRNK